MKSVILLLAVACAAARIQHEGFRPGTELVYRYEGQTVTGVPHYGVEYAGLKIRAAARIQMRSGHQAVLKLEEIELLKLQPELPQWPESGLIPDSLCTPLDEPAKQHMVRELAKVIAFRYERGQVSDVQITAGDKEWSVNLKKGLLSSLKVQLTGKSSDDGIDSMDDLVSKFKDSLVDRPQSSVKTASFMESDNVGTCETLYKVDMTNDLQRTIKVTKVKNYQNCEKQTHFQKGIFSGLTLLPHEISLKDFIDRSAVTEYEISGHPADFIIRKIRQDGKFIATPLSQEHGNAVTNTILRMDLVETKDIEREIEPSNDLKRVPEGLLSKWSESEVKRDSRDSMEVDSVEDRSWESDMEAESEEDRKRKIDELLEEILPLVEPVVQEESVLKVRKIEKLLKTLPKNSIISLCEKYIREASSTDRAEKKRELILDIIPALGQSKVLPVLAKLITTQKISPARGILSLRLAIMTVNPDVELLRFLSLSNREFAAHSVVSSNPMLQSTVYSALSTVVRRFMVKFNNTGVPMETVYRIVERALPAEEVYNRVKNSHNSDELSALIKYMKTSGHPVFIPLMQKLAKDKSQDIRVRKNAIYSFQAMPKQLKKKIANTLLSVYSDTTDVSEMRVAAFVALMDTMPEKASLDAIVKIQKNETNVEVGSIVSSYIFSIAKADLPGYKKLAARVQKILPKLRAIMPDTMKYAKQYHIDYFSKNTQSGIGLDLRKSFGPILPSKLVSKVHVHALGKTIREALSAGVYMKGSRNILSKLSGISKDIVGSLDDKPLKDVIESLLRPIDPEDLHFGDVASEIEGIQEKLGISNRPRSEKINLGFYLQVFGNDVLDVYITKEDILRWLNEGEMPLIGNLKDLIEEISTRGKSFDILKILHLGSSSQQVPTPLGIPMYVNLTATAVSKVSGDIKMVGSSLMDIIKYGLSGHIPDEISLQAFVKPSMVTVLKGRTGVHFGLLSTGVSLTAKVKSNLPTKLNINWNRNSGKLTTLIELPQREQEVLKVDIIPETFVSIKNPRESVLSKIYQTKPLKQVAPWEGININIPLPLSWLNTEVKINGYFQHSKKSYMPVNYLWGKKSLVVQLSPIESARPIKIELSYHTGVSNYRRMDRDYELPEVQIHRLISDPKLFKTGISIGSQSSNKARISITAIMSTDGKLYQLNGQMIAPGYTSGPISGDFFVNLKALEDQFYRQSQASSDSVIEVRLKTGSGKRLDAKLEPYSGAPVSWDKWTDNIYKRTLESMTGSEIVVTKPDGQSESSRKVNYKLTIEGERIDWHKAEKIGLGLVSVSYALMGSSVPSIDVKDSALSPPNRIEGFVTVEPKLQKAKIVMKTPTSTQYGIEIPTYIWQPTYNITSLVKPVLGKNSSLFSRYYPRSFSHRVYGDDVCMVTPNSSGNDDTMTTYDSHTYTLPRLPAGCEVLLSKDCSYMASFSVLMQETQENEKKLKILIPNNKIEIVPSSGRGWFSAGSSEIIVKVNGVEMSLQEGDSEPMMGKSRDRSRVRIGEARKSGERVIVHLSSAKLFVSTDGKTVEIKADAHKNVLCGLCGNNNGDTIDEYEGPDMLYYPKKVMISKYVLPSDVCPSSTIREHYQVQDIDRSQCQISSETQVKQRGDRICFTKQPVPVCPDGCEPEETRPQQFQLHCKNPNEYDARMYLDELKRRPILSSIDDKPTNGRFTQDVPSKCIRRW